MHGHNHINLVKKITSKSQCLSHIMMKQIHKYLDIEHSTLIQNEQIVWASMVNILQVSMLKPFLFMSN